MQTHLPELKCGLRYNNVNILENFSLVVYNCFMDIQIYRDENVMRKYRNYEESLKVRLADSAYAKAYLIVALEEYEEDGNIEAFLLAIRDVANAQGGLSKLAEHTELSQESLYKALSENRTLQFDTIGPILHGLGFKFSIESLENSPQ